jgi:hypothetical protein
LLGLQTRILQPIPVSASMSAAPVPHLDPNIDPRLQIVAPPVVASANSSQLPNTPHVDPQISCRLQIAQHPVETPPSQSHSQSQAPGVTAPLPQAKAAQSEPRDPTRKAPRQSLAQPLDDEWAKVYNAADRERQMMKTLKIQQQEMEDRKKRTCLLVLFHTVCCL